MKKIKNLEQLEYEKKLLDQKEQLLYYKIKSSWHDLKTSLKPVNLAKDFFSSIFKKKAK
ncbi:MAG: hypothetical protein ABIW38_09495 [Ferruginibacter sp.]